jgi:hypothetical protein
VACNKVRSKTSPLDSWQDIPSRLGLVNAVVVQDCVNSARRVVENDVFKELNELNRTLSTEFPVDEAAFAAVVLGLETISRGVGADFINAHDHVADP